MYFLGIDIGTSAAKAVLVNDNQDIVAEAEVALTIMRRHPSWSEQNPGDWWLAVEKILAQFHHDHPKALSAVRGIGLSGQMHGAVLLGADQVPLRPAMLWNDSRAGAQAQALNSQFPQLAQVLGVLPMAGLTAPKLPWLAIHEPQVLAKLATLMLPKDYVRLQLTGEIATDMSDAAGTWLLDQARRDWCDDALAALHLKRSQLPRLLEGSSPSGVLRPALAQAYGMGDDVIVAGGAGDAAAGAIGIGAIDEGDAFLSLGTSGQMFVTTADYRPAPQAMIHAFCNALPQRWLQMAAMLSAASCLSYAADLFKCDVATLLGEAGELSNQPTNLLFLPYLTGERTPHNDADARGVIFGLSPEHGRGEVVRAIMEGVAFSFADARDCLAQSGTIVRRAGVIGGGARSKVWLQMIANVLDIPLVRYHASARGPAFGAARLARLAVTGENAAAICSAPAIEGMVEPQADLVGLYQERLPKFRSLYRALRNEFHS
ncbi:MAG: xylulokinase [Hyphomicrobiales bacterium]|nr:xylulokinase [Hyphomicrobiales bacterium]MDE2114209.1 xylulokinase [Hyphomicrobiales bacterium]